MGRDEVCSCYISDRAACSAILFTPHGLTIEVAEAIKANGSIEVADEAIKATNGAIEAAHGMIKATNGAIEVANEAIEAANETTRAANGITLSKKYWQGLTKSLQ
jgi:hypothetical protein